MPRADGYYAIGDIRRLKGDFEGAEAALREAHGLGRSPQPALALLRLAEGKVKAAAARDQFGRPGGDLGSMGQVPAPAGPGRDRRRRRRPGPRSRGRRGAEPDRRRLPVAGPHGRQAPGLGPAAPGRRGSHRRRRRAAQRDPGLARGRRAVRDRPVPSTARQGAPRDRRRRRRGPRAPGGPRRVRRLGARPDVEAVDRDAAGTPRTTNRPGPGAQDVHVHRHRRVDQPGRAAR